MNLSDKIFGSNVDSDIQDIFKELQEGRFEVNPNAGIKPSPHTHYLGDRAPFARMWTAVNVKDAQDKDDKGKNTVYIINDNRENSYDETTIHSSVLKHQLTNNQYLKPTAGITGINSKSEGAVGALRRTTVDFVVHNKVDFDNIFLPFFLRPGTMVFVDFGWSDDALSLYNPVDKINNNDLKLSNLYSNLYDSKTGEIAKQKGLMSTLCGAVTKYDVTVDEMGSFKCNLEFVSQNYTLLDKEITEDNSLKFLFANFMDEFLVGYVVRSLGEGNIDVGGSDTYADFDTKLLRKLSESEVDEYSTAFFDSGMTVEPGVIDSTSKKIGVFFQNLGGDGDADYLDEKESLYISFGLFEDLFLNNFISQWVETTEEGDEIASAAKPDDIYGLKFTSIDSWVRFDPDLFAIQKTPLRSNDEVPSYLYPNSWDIKDGESETSNKIRPSIWYDVEGKLKDNSHGIDLNYKDNQSQVDRDKKRIPLRELFISVPVIQEAFTASKNINDALEFIFDVIWRDSTNIINIKMISHNDSQVALAFQDVNLTGHIIPDEPILTFDLTSGNSVVLNSDLKFETPKAGLSSMIAIKNTKQDVIFENLDDLKLSFLNVLETTPNTGNKKMIIKSLPDIGFVSQKKKTIDADIKKIFDSITSGNSNIERGDFKVDGNPVSERYMNYINSKRVKLTEIIEAEKEAKGVKQPVPIDLPTHTKDGKLIKYVSSDREKLLMDARIKNFIDAGESSIAPIMPITLSLTIYGNNFLSYGEYINVNFFPDHWQDRVFFQIMGVDHSVDTSIWKTTYTTAMRIKPNKKVYLTGNQQSNKNNNVVTRFHPLYLETTAGEVAGSSNMENKFDKDTVKDKETTLMEIKVLKHIQVNHPTWGGDGPFGFASLDLKKDVTFTITEWLHDPDEAIRKNSTKPEGQKLSTTDLKNAKKLSAVGLTSEIADGNYGQLAWILAVSDLILGDDYLNWSAYKTSDHEDMTLVNGSVGIQQKKKLNDSMYGDIPKDMIYFNPIWHSTGGGDDIRGDFQKLILDPMEDETWTPGWLDDTQKAIIKYIEERKLFTSESYILNRIKASRNAGFAKKVWEDGVSPILMSVIFGKGKTVPDGEWFVEITGNWSDFKIIPNIMIPKRILKDTNLEKVATSLFEIYIKHYINLMKIVK